MVAILVVSMIVAFIVIDIVVRIVSEKMREAKTRRERLVALDIGLNLDFTHEAKSLKRVEVSHPLAPSLRCETMRLMVSFAAVEGSAMIGLPPLLRAAPRMKSTWPPMPL